MGQELACKLHYRQRMLSGKALLETDHVLFRGDERLKLPFKELTAVRASGGVLLLDFAGEPAAFELGDAAEKWAQKILHPPSRMDKLGVTAAVVVQLAGEFDADFLSELAGREAVMSDGAPETKADLIFFAAEKQGDLKRIRKLINGMKPQGAVWVVYAKGGGAIHEMDVLEVTRSLGLKDTKVAAFSPTLTALRFVIPLGDRRRFFLTGKLGGGK